MDPPRLNYRTVYAAWWPLAASWLLMSVELPAISAVVSRLADPQVHLAAYGGVVFPLALLVEAPIIMLLAASTALSKDRVAYDRLARFTHALSFLLTLGHALVALTPLYDVVVGGLIDPPPEVLEEARLGLIIMLPWTWAIAYRRFNQGVLIRRGYSRVVGVGTGIRLLADGTVLVTGFMLGYVPGIVVATLTVIAGVLVEAVYIRIKVARVIREELPARGDSPPLGVSAFLAFYIPLSLTSILSLLTQPVGSAAMSRLALPLESLAVWPVVSGVVFLLRSFGFAYNEVVVALLERPRSVGYLRRFTLVLAGLTSLAYLLLLVPAVAVFWLEDVTGLSPELASLARRGLWLALPMPALSVLISWYQGIIVHSGRTRAVSEAVGISLTVIVGILLLAVLVGGVTGIYAALAAIAVGEMVRTGWLWYRSRRIRQCLYEEEFEAGSPALPRTRGSEGAI